MGYVRLDVDGAVAADQTASCGGLVRDEKGFWIVGFHQEIESGPPTMAELTAIKIGLEVCKNRGLSRIHLHSDSLNAIQLLMSGSEEDHPYSQLIRDVRSLIFSNWDLKIYHSHREVLTCADIMAKLNSDPSNVLQLFQEPPVPCGRQLAADVAGLD